MLHSIRLRASTLGLVLAAALFSAGCGKRGFDKLPEEQVDAARKHSAEEMGTKILSAWAKDEYPLLGEEAAPGFRRAHNEEDAQRVSDKALEKDLGNFKSMTYVETVRSKDGKFEVYRFKGSFEKSEAPNEVRVVLDTQGKLTGFWIKPWKDQI
ncbi:MAG: hypothetical protein IPI67_06980 [Myxococcales bacterium]|nr:hypothetical protein [Myxococcales bacterium]